MLSNCFKLGCGSESDLCDILHGFLALRGCDTGVHHVNMLLSLFFSTEYLHGWAYMLIKHAFFHLVMADGNFIQLVKQTCLQTHLRYQEITTRRYRGALVFNLESNIYSSFAFYLRGNKRLFTCLSPTVTTREWQIWKLLCLTYYSLWIILIFGSNITSGITLLRMCHFFSLMCSVNYVLMQISNQPVI